MKKIDCAQEKRSFAQSVYVHSVATSFVFVRNFRVYLEESFIAGEIHTA